jgi:excisionase family DNA binding protein
MGEEVILDLLEKHGARLEKIENLLQLQKEVLNLEELSLYTGLAKSTIYKKTADGLIPFYKQSGYLFFDRVEVLEWLKSNKGFNAAETTSKSASWMVPRG